MAKLGVDEIEKALVAAPGWVVEKKSMERTWTFADFAGSMEFVNKVAVMAEKADHHPDIDIRYNKVHLSLMTHDVEGISDKDAEMARTLSFAFPTA